MAQGGHQRKLDRLKQRLERWRQQYGGPGRQIPDELWAEAAEIAGLIGVEAVARSLRMDRLRLAGQTEPRHGSKSEAGERGQFVELDASRLCPMAKAVVRFDAPDGERMEIEISNASALDVAALASAFWSRPR